MDIVLEMKQDLKLAMTQEMKLSLNILEMSLFDLERYLIKITEINPLIDVEFSNSYSKKYSDEEEFSPLDIAYKEENLIDFLEEQIGYLKINKKIDLLCRYIVNNLDKKGYLSIGKKEIRDLTKYSMKDIEKALDIVKSLEPVGIGTSNLEECLIIQLHKKNINDITLEKLIRYFLKELSEKKYDEISQKLKISEEKIKEYFEIIRKLNPIPARGFYMGDMTNYISPEAEIKKVGGEYKVVMLEENSPKIKIKKVEIEDGKLFYNSALNLINFVEKRRETLKRILETILENQYEFFSKKNGKLKTFTSKDLSEILDVHPSTVSRAVKNKYVLTEKGIIRIKDLFVLNGEKEIIKNLLERIVSEEDREKPYTDQEISDYLRKNEIKIARRTIAKYREELGIKSASKRKIKII